MRATRRALVAACVGSLFPALAGCIGDRPALRFRNYAARDLTLTLSITHRSTGTVVFEESLVPPRAPESTTRDDVFPEPGTYDVEARIRETDHEDTAVWSVRRDDPMFHAMIREPDELKLAAVSP